uniref:Uncharacterized protein n=1 Tax=Anguilla anguilla TaxID=7936 RepID=A0A0E9RQ17_ANGAN
MAMKATYIIILLRIIILVFFYQICLPV